MTQTSNITHHWAGGARDAQGENQGLDIIKPLR